jgi:hypothetical protein
MKKFLFGLLWCVSQNVHSQEPLELGMAGGTFDFELPEDSLYVLFDTNHVWVIAETNKTILFPHNHFGHTLITDTTGFYDSNISASCNFKLIFGAGSFYEIMFFHKFDFENNKDGGIIETSYDNGTTWQNIIFDPVIFGKPEDLGNFFNITDTIVAAGNQPGFTGLQSEYMASWVRFPADRGITMDTVLLRFTILSDSTDAGNEGWMLDDFYFGGGYVAIKDFSSKSDFMVYPVPSSNTLSIDCTGKVISQVKVLSQSGITLIEKSGDNISSINIENLAPGCYLVYCRDHENNYRISKFFKI